jgi:hypothetical protein
MKNRNEYWSFRGGDSKRFDRDKVPYSILGKLIDKVSASKQMETKNVKLLENLKKALEA